MRRNRAYLAVVSHLLIFLAACAGTRNTLTVSEVIQNAKALDGSTIRVRGEAFHWIEPSREAMWMFGGCAVPVDPSHSTQGVTVGWLAIYDQIDEHDLRHYGAPHDELGIKISESSFSCEGDYCGMSCSAFEIISRRSYEFIGVLRVNSGTELVLEDIDLDRSRQLVDGNWVSIQKGDFEVWFP